MSKEKISKRSEKNLNEKNKIISEENKPMILNLIEIMRKK